MTGTVLCAVTSVRDVTFPDEVDPTAAYTLPRRLVVPLSAAEITAPAAGAEPLIREVTGRDPLAEIHDALAGDWAGLVRAGEVLSGLAAGVAAVARNVRAGDTRLARGWDGQAADAAHLWFAGFARDLELTGTVLTALHDKHTTAVGLLCELSGTLADTVRRLADAVTVAASVAAASGMPGAPVGAAALHAAATAQAGQWAQDVTGLLTAARNTVEDLRDAMAGHADLLTGVAPPPDGYAHPALDRRTTR